MTQVFENAKIVRSVQPGVRLATSVTSVAVTAVSGGTVAAVTNLAKASTSAKDTSIEEEKAFDALRWAALAEDWESPADADFDTILRDADLQ